MTLKSHISGWSLFFLAAFSPGVHLQRHGSSSQPSSDSELPSEAQISRPVLQPSEAPPSTGTYLLNDRVGKPCIRATMGAEYIVTEKKKTWYFNLDPSSVKTGGNCDKETAVLSLTLPNQAASLQFTFRKENNFIYVTNVTAHVSPQPVCQGCANKTYSGVITHKKLFTAANSQSFKCKSGKLLLMSSELKIRLVPLQMQAFSVPNRDYGPKMECWADFNKRAIPIILGAVAVGLVVIALLTFQFIKDRRRPGYDRI
ncbi:lysosome-associated membrane glycoprotein 3 isoform X1 [Stegastes partitus]|uniref:Lysosome-associated membrane glycoprotein 3-like n=1 Tax=Stegastes partitus TaxID=144197 RepID=A0A3B5AA95_9TELE|nr:PREDICTED: lysosome-associated membrane glycoprotein 3-like isoform X1 [Stegastes partitus]